MDEELKPQRVPTPKPWRVAAKPPLVMPDNGGPAFPQQGSKYRTRTEEDGDVTMHILGSPGMSLRAWFMGQVLNGAALSWDKDQLNQQCVARRLAANAALIADAAIAELNKPPECKL